MTSDTSDSPEALATPLIVGWREWVSLPGWNVRWIKAKIDTGARTSAIHAFDLEEFERDGQPWVRFSIHPWQRGDDDHVEVECPILDQRDVKSSNGSTETRFAVEIDIRLAGRRLLTPVTLSNRDEMGFRMLIGREALSQGFMVDSSQSYAGGRPRRATRRKNWGR